MQQQQAGGKSIIGVIATIVLIATAWALPSATNAQDKSSAAYGTGLIFTAPETYAALPNRARVRGVVATQRVDLSPYFPRPGFQGRQASCAAWAVGYGARSYYAGAERGNRRFEQSDVISPNSIFNQTTTGIRGEGPKCGGVRLTSTLDFLRTKGAVTASLWPVDTNTCEPNQPSPQQSELAGALRIPGYSIFPQSDLKDPRRYREVLAKHHPIIVAMQVSVDDLAAYRGGVFNVIRPLEARPYGHAMVLVGFDDVARTFLLYNSWGDHWGEGGLMRISYDSFFDQIREAYVIEGLRPISTAPPAPPPTMTPNQLRNGVRCGIVSVREGSEGITVEGFASTEDISRLQSMAPQLGRPVKLAVTETPWPGCEARMITANLPEALRIGVVNLQAPELTADRAAPALLRRGDSFRVDIDTPGSGHLQVFFLQADRSAKLLYSGPTKDLGGGRSGVRLGGGSLVNLQANAPFGPEAIVAFMGPTAVLPGGIGAQFEEHEFLDQLSAALKAAQSRGVAFRTGYAGVVTADQVSKADAWLVTPAEVKSFRDTAGADAFVPEPPGAVRTSRDPSGPVLTLANGQSAGGWSIRARPAAGTSISPDRLKLSYRAPSGWIDVTSRLGDRMRVDGDAIAIVGVKLPPGRHRLRVQAWDTSGKAGEIAWSVDAPK